MVQYHTNHERRYLRKSLILSPSLPHLLGICSGLFTNAELIRIQNVLRRDHSKKAITAETIARLIQHNLHVVIAWDIDRVTESPIPTETASQNGSVRLDPKQEEMTRDVFSMLCSQCSVVDHYQTWRQRELCEVAQRWWREKTCSLDQGWVNSGEFAAFIYMCMYIFLCHRESTGISGWSSSSYPPFIFVYTGADSLPSPSSSHFPNILHSNSDYGTHYCHDSHRQREGQTAFILIIFILP